jgi:hypothetical protein
MIKENITSTIARPSISTLRFINKISLLGIGVGSLKYLIAESNITLLIDALNPLRSRKNSNNNTGTERILSTNHFLE